MSDRLPENLTISDFIAAWGASPFRDHTLRPWAVTSALPSLLETAIAELGSDYEIDGQIAIHRSAMVESGAILKGPAILGPNAFVAATAYLRGGVYLDANCIVGPACELKTVIMFAGAKVAHLSFVSDSIVGARANIEAGAIVANYRNEMDDKRIRIDWNGTLIDTGVDKFGALIGDEVRVGANAVIAPGALLAPHFRLPRLAKLDQHPEPLEQRE